MKWVGEACRRAMIGQLQNVISQSEPRELKMIAIKCLLLADNQSNCKQTAAVNHAYHSEIRFSNSLEDDTNEYYITKHKHRAKL